MARSSTEICNLALSWVGGNKISSLADDESKEAVLCRANYDMSRKAVLEEREWTFSVKRLVLTPLATKPLFGYSYEFLVPPDLLASISVYAPNQINNTNPPMLLHVVEDNKILANIAEILVKYKGDVENTTRFSALFDQALAAHIGANIAIPLTENSSLHDKLLLIYDDKLQRATSSDSLQGSRERLEISQMEQSRRVGVGLD